MSARKNELPESARRAFMAAGDAADRAHLAERVANGYVPPTAEESFAKEIADLRAAGLGWLADKRLASRAAKTEA